MSKRDRDGLLARLKRSRRSLERMQRRGQGDTIGALELSWHIHDLEVYLDELV